MSILYVGDLHGRVEDIDSVIHFAESNRITALVQVGDFGIGFPSDELRAFFQDRAEQDWQVPIYTCGGNHDNWDWLYSLMDSEQPLNPVELYAEHSGLYFLPRGSLLEIDGLQHLFLGGAESTDRHRRTEGETWWAREEATDAEFGLFLNQLNEFRPDTVISHDAPLRVKLFRIRRNQSRTPNWFEKCLNQAQHYPKRWYFGHHHLLEQWKVSGIKFYCCGLGGQYWLYERYSIDREIE